MIILLNISSYFSFQGTSKSHTWRKGKEGSPLNPKAFLTPLPRIGIFCQQITVGIDFPCVIIHYKAFTNDPSRNDFFCSEDCISSTFEVESQRMPTSGEQNQEQLTTLMRKNQAKCHAFYNLLWKLWFHLEIFFLGYLELSPAFEVMQDCFTIS